MPSSPDPRDLLASDDPVRHFWAAHEAGECIALRTSGTTTSPRIVVRSTASWVDSFAAVSQLSGLAGDSALWIPGPVTATMNLFAHVHASFAGASVTQEPGPATHAVLTPLGLRRALSDPEWGRGVTVIVAGDALGPSLAEMARQRGIHVHHYYGASELSFVAWSVDGAGLVPFPGVECRLDGRGVIWARSPYLSEGYLDASPGPLRWDDEGFATVGDHGALRDGVLTVNGRGEEGVTTAGVTVVVADVEALLRPLACGDVLLLGLPDERLGAVLTCVLTEPSDLAPLQAAVTQLAAAERPRRWEVLREIPMTDAGKPDRAGVVDLLAPRAPQQVGRWPRD